MTAVEAIGSRRDTVVLRAPLAGVMLIAAGASLWGIDGVLRKPLTTEWSAWTIVLYEHAILTCVVAPILWRHRDQMGRVGPGHAALHRGLRRRLLEPGRGDPAAEDAAAVGDRRRRGDPGRATQGRVRRARDPGRDRHLPALVRLAVAGRSADRQPGQAGAVRAGSGRAVGRGHRLWPARPARGRAEHPDGPALLAGIAVPGRDRDPRARVAARAQRRRQRLDAAGAARAGLRSAGDDALLPRPAHDAGADRDHRRAGLSGDG